MRCKASSSPLDRSLTVTWSNNSTFLSSDDGECFLLDRERNLVHGYSCPPCSFFPPPFPSVFASCSLCFPISPHPLFNNKRIKSQITLPQSAYPLLLSLQCRLECKTFFSPSNWSKSFLVHLPLCIVSSSSKLEKSLVQEIQDCCDSLTHLGS